MKKESILYYKNIRFVPSFHSKLQFALEVRKVFTEFLPDIVAVELPDIYYSEVIKALDRLPRLSMICLDQNKDVYAYIPIFPSDSMVEGMRLAKTNRLPISFIDLAISNYRIEKNTFELPDEYVIQEIGLEKFYETIIPYFPKSEIGSDDRKREELMAFHLQRLMKQFKKILFIGGMTHWEVIKELLEKEQWKFHPHELESVKPPFLATPGKGALYSLLTEIPYLVYKYELSRQFSLNYDQLREIEKMVLQAKQSSNLKEEFFSPREFKNLMLYARNLALMDKTILPDLFNLLTASKGVLGDDYSIELLDLALKYPFIEDDPNIPVIDFDPKSGFMMSGRKITLRRRLPVKNVSSDPRNNWQEVKLKRRKKEDIPKDEEFNWVYFGFFSHIPEDIILEGFIDRLCDKLANELNEGEPRIFEFQGSMMDGIDIRTTIRYRNLTNKLYVKEYPKYTINIGAWVLIFDPDLSEEKYPWSLALSAEHHNESDLSFYATNPALHPVTRQIVRADYGAILAIKPPLPSKEKVDWMDLEVPEEYRHDQLLQLAISKSPRNGILYVNSTPPAEYYYNLASQKGKTLFYLPINRVSKKNLKILRRFHLLKNRSTRDIASEYI